MEYDLRHLTPGDLDRYRQLRQRALAEEPEAYATSLDEQQAADPETLGRLLTPSPTRFVVGAFCGGELVGLLGLRGETRPHLRHKGTLWGGYVRPDHRRRGVGAGLLTAVVRTCEGNPVLERLRIMVEAENGPALRLLGRAGFGVFGVERGAAKVQGRDVDKVYLALHLRAEG